LSTAEVLLALSLVAVIALLGTLILRGRGGSHMRTSLEAGALKWSFELSQETKQDVEQRLDEAIAKTGKNQGERVARERLNAVRQVQPARLLWVDDHPDNNVEETLMLTGLGVAITQATSTEAALRYLDKSSFDLLITDLGRGDDPVAGVDLIERLAATNHRPSVIVYTLDPGDRGPLAIDRGAEAVLETPGELLEAILSRLAR
jgi:CheY-like chemotaxis protein